MTLFFRSAATSTGRRFSNVIAASLVAASAALTPLPTAAREIEGLPDQCANAGNELAKLKCGRAVFQQRRRDADARGAEADKQIAVNRKSSADAKARGAEADKKTAASRSTKECNDSVTRDIQAASKAGPLTPGQVRDFETRIAGCDRS